MRVGFLFNGDTASHWQQAIVQQVAARSDVKTTIVAIDVEREPRRWAPWKRTRDWLAEDAVQIERRLFRRTVRRHPPLADLVRRQPLPPLPGVGTVALRDVALDAQGRLAPGAAAVTALRELQLDVLVSFAGYPCAEPLCQAAVHGVWALCHGDGRIIGPWMTVGFWECHRGIKRTVIALERLAAEPGQRWIMRRGWYPTEMASWTRNATMVMEHARQLVPDALAQLQRSGRLPAAPTEDLDSSEMPLYRTPGPWDYWTGMFRLTVRWARYYFLSGFWVEQWLLLTGRSDSPLNVSPATLQRTIAPKGQWLADPFLLREGSRTWVFAEEMDPGQHAHIAAFEWMADGLHRAGTALDPGYHLSYPFVFQYAGRWCMIPESAANRTIELWECEQLPLQWRRRKVLLDNLVAADSTLIRHDGRWWLFTNIARSSLMQNLCLELFIYSTDDLLNGDWQPHDANPVITDCRRARMAGPIFVEDGQLYRSCQRNSLDYGEAVEICRIDRLTQSEYLESVVRVLEPEAVAGSTGLHHLCAVDGLVIMDVKRRVLKASL